MIAGSVAPASDGYQPVFDRLERLADDRGLFEHTLRAVPRREHGYCVDDVARGLGLGVLTDTLALPGVPALGCRISELE